MLDAIRLLRPVGALIGLFRVVLLDMRGRQLHLDDVRAEQCRHVRGIGADVERQFAVLRQLAAARIAPDDGGDADRLRLFGQFADLLHLLEDAVRAGIDGEADRRATEAQRVADAGGHRLVDAGRPAVRAVDLEDRRDLAGEGVGARLERSQGRGVGGQAGVDRDLIVIVRIVGGGIDRERARGSVFEALVDRQDDELAGAAQLALHQDARKVALHRGAGGFVFVEDRFDGGGDGGHRGRSLGFVSGVRASASGVAPGRSAPCGWGWRGRSPR